MHPYVRIPFPSLNFLLICVMVETLCTTTRQGQGHCLRPKVKSVQILPYLPHHSRYLNGTVHAYVLPLDSVSRITYKVKLNNQCPRSVTPSHIHDVLSRRWRGHSCRSDVILVFSCTCTTAIDDTSESWRLYKVNEAGLVKNVTIRQVKITELQTWRFVHS